LPQRENNLSFSQTETIRYTNLLCGCGVGLGLAVGIHTVISQHGQLEDKSNSYTIQFRPKSLNEKCQYYRLLVQSFCQRYKFICVEIFIQKRCCFKKNFLQINSKFVEEYSLCCNKNWAMREYFLISKNVWCLSVFSILLIRAVQEIDLSGKPLIGLKLTREIFFIHTLFPFLFYGNLFLMATTSFSIPSAAKSTTVLYCILVSWWEQQKLYYRSTCK
jgi:hypothetical protein